MFERDDLSVSRPCVKICGITNSADAAAAIESGADALGFNFFQGSKRYLALEAARGWLSELPSEIVKIAVLVDPGWEEATAVAGLPFITGLQLHGRENPAFCRRLKGDGIEFVKALPATATRSLANASSFFTRTILLDSSPAGQFGGSGRTFPWEIARDFVAANADLRVILAGGLTPENVAEAVEFVRPFGVDVTTGVESSPGRKDHRLLRAFIAAARGR